MATTHHVWAAAPPPSLPRLRARVVDYSTQQPDVTSAAASSGSSAASSPASPADSPTAAPGKGQSSSYTAYHVRVTCNGRDWGLLRRYNHFLELHASLRGRYERVAAFDFPNKSKFRTSFKSTKDRRRAGFDDYLAMLCGLSPAPAELYAFLEAHRYLAPSPKPQRTTATATAAAVTTPTSAVTPVASRNDGESTLRHRGSQQQQHQQQRRPRVDAKQQTTSSISSSSTNTNAATGTASSSYSSASMLSPSASALSRVTTTVVLTTGAATAVMAYVWRMLLRGGEPLSATADAPKVAFVWAVLLLASSSHH